MRVQRESGQLIGRNPLQTTKQASHTSLSEIFIPKMERVEDWESFEGKHHVHRPCFNSSVPGAHLGIPGCLEPWLKAITDLLLFQGQMGISTLSMVTGKLNYLIACNPKTATVIKHFLISGRFMCPTTSYMSGG